VKPGLTRLHDVSIQMSSTDTCAGIWYVNQANVRSGSHSDGKSLET